MGIMRTKGNFGLFSFLVLNLVSGYSIVEGNHMTKRQEERRESLLPDNQPKNIRVYDSGPDGAMDRYTVVYTGNYRERDGWFQYLGMNASPFHPQGIGQHGESPTQIDRPTYSHLGKKINFAKLPIDCKIAVLQDYNEIWGLGLTGDEIRTFAE
jgi:hypothetical protein